MERLLGERWVCLFFETLAGGDMEKTICNCISERQTGKGNRNRKEDFPAMNATLSLGRTIGLRSPLLYGHFIEHFHRQIYGGVYMPGHPLSDGQGFRTDVVEAMRHIHVPVLRWPGGCFVSAYHWKYAVGPERTPMFDKAWRVEDPNTFGTDEYIALCRKVSCAPYICTNAGTGTPEEMSDWVEYCNLPNQGMFAAQRIRNGFPQPYGVPYWSIGNENYGFWELGAKDAQEWGRLVVESAKLMKHVDPTIQLSAAALADLDWNVNLLKHCGRYIDWISIHRYWNLMPEKNDFATYEETMAYTNDLDTEIRKVRGLLMAMGLEKSIKIAYDEWNLRGWHHPNVHTIRQGVDVDAYLTPRDLNDRNQDYTMADAVFSACFLNTLNRNCDIVGMANFAPIVNTRGCIFTHEKGIVLRSTYHVFDLYVNYLGDEVLESWTERGEEMAVLDKNGRQAAVQELDVLATRHRDSGMLAIAAVNKHPEQARSLQLPEVPNGVRYRAVTVQGNSTESYNDIGREEVTLRAGDWKPFHAGLTVLLPPHSVQVIQIQ